MIYQKPCFDKQGFYFWSPANHYLLGSKQKRSPMKAIFALLSIVLLTPGGINAQDWGQLGEFREANAKINSVMTHEERVVFFGNSITIGWLHTVPSFFEGKAYVNRGISGQTTPQMLVRFRQDVIDLNPKVVVILAGTNDIAGNTGPMTLEETLSNLKSMTELAMAHDIAVILCSVLPASDYPWRPGLQPDVKIPALNTMIEAYTEEAGAVYQDYFSEMANEKMGLDEALAHDGVHPTEKGYQIMAPLAETAIREALNRKGR